MEAWLSGLLHHFTYVAIFGVLTAAGLGAPVSEDLVELIAGGLAAKGVTSLWPTLAAVWFGVLCGDTLIHQWGARLGPKAWELRWVQKALSPARQVRLRGHFARHGMLTVIAGRHLPGLRAPTFFCAGASGLSLGRFLVADAISAAITVPAVVMLGYLFAAHLDEVRANIRTVQWILLAVLAAGLAVFLLLRARRKRRDSTR